MLEFPHYECVLLKRCLTGFKRIVPRRVCIKNGMLSYAASDPKMHSNPHRRSAGLLVDEYTVVLKCDGFKGMQYGLVVYKTSNKSAHRETYAPTDTKWVREFMCASEPKFVFDAKDRNTQRGLYEAIHESINICTKWRNLTHTQEAPTHTQHTHTDTLTHTDIKIHKIGLQRRNSKVAMRCINESKAMERKMSMKLHSTKELSDLLQTEKDIVKQLLKEYKSELQHLKDKTKQLEDEEWRLSRENSNLKEEVSNSESENKKVSDELSDLEFRYVDLNSQLIHTSTHRDELLWENQKLLGDCDILANDNTHLIKEIHTLRQEAEKLRKCRVYVQEKNKRLQKTFQDFTASYTQAQDSFFNSQTRLQKQHVEILNRSMNDIKPVESQVCEQLDKSENLLRISGETIVSFCSEKETLEEQKEKVIKNHTFIEETLKNTQTGYDDYMQIANETQSEIQKIVEEIALLKQRTLQQTQVFERSRTETLKANNKRSPYLGVPDCEVISTRCPTSPAGNTHGDEGKQSLFPNTPPASHKLDEADGCE